MESHLLKFSMGNNSFTKAEIAIIKLFGDLFLKDFDAYLEKVEIGNSVFLQLYRKGTYSFPTHQMNPQTYMFLEKDDYGVALGFLFIMKAFNPEIIIDDDLFFMKIKREKACLNDNNYGDFYKKEALEKIGFLVEEAFHYCVDDMLYFSYVITPPITVLE